jgi:hypothetical protein
LTQPATRVEVPIQVRRYVRAEIVGNQRPGDMPPDAPPGIDLRNWRWALSNPVYVRRVDAN